jgi:hypothetical protein
VLLDEHLPRLLARELPGHDVRTVSAEGWAGVLNGELLRRAEAAGFEVFVTADRALEFQQSLPARGLGFVILETRSTKLDVLRQLAPALRDALEVVEQGQVLYIKPLT